MYKSGVWKEASQSETGGAKSMSEGGLVCSSRKAVETSKEEAADRGCNDS